MMACGVVGLTSVGRLPTVTTAVAGDRSSSAGRSAGAEMSVLPTPPELQSPQHRGKDMNRATRIAFGFVTLCALTGLMLGQEVRSQHCTEEPVTTKTRWGGNESVVIDLRDKPVRMVSGTVRGPGIGSLSTLVQVFPRKPSDPIYRASDQNESPVTACLTGDDGAFAFLLPPGEYELRMSQNVGVDVTSVFVTVRRGARRSSKVRVVMKVGT